MRLGWIDAAGEVLEEGLLAELGGAVRLDEAGIGEVSHAARSIMLTHPETDPNGDSSGLLRRWTSGSPSL
jgi:hypothetical protein